MSKEDIKNNKIDYFQKFMELDKLVGDSFRPGNAFYDLAKQGGLDKKFLENLVLLKKL